MANRRVLRKTLVLIGGAVLFLLGVVGIIVPIMPGVLFFIAALLLMSTEFAWAERALGTARQWIARRRLDGPGRRRLDAAGGDEPQSLEDRPG